MTNDTMWGEVGSIFKQLIAYATLSGAVDGLTRATAACQIEKESRRGDKRQLGG